MLVILITKVTVNCAYHPEPLRAEQLIIVTTDHWDSIHAQLFAFEKRKGEWKLEFSFGAVVGKKGMAIGNGIRKISVIGAPSKKEGDMKSPAGIFLLGPAFGYAPDTETGWMHIPYIRVTDALICVDDPLSVRYNKMIKSDTVEKDWNTNENMHRKGGDYKWGVFVQQNFSPVRTGMGSCVFLHIWEDESKGTAGCTAMEEKNILRLLKWIRADKNPLLVQVPEFVYKEIRSAYFLPLL
jgi:D-alanyl-D-alanine dipeptidase